MFRGYRCTTFSHLMTSSAIPHFVGFEHGNMALRKINLAPRTSESRPIRSNLTKPIDSKISPNSGASHTHPSLKHLYLLHRRDLKRRSTLFIVVVTVGGLFGFIFLIGIAHCLIDCYRMPRRSNALTPVERNRLVREMTTFATHAEARAHRIEAPPPPPPPPYERAPSYDAVVRAERPDNVSHS